MNEKQQKQIKEAGITLVEMLVVIALLGIVVTFVGGPILQKFERAKVDATKIQIRNMGSILDQFRLDCGFYPSSDMGLKALVSKPEGERECKNYDPEGYIKDKKVPKDGWGWDFEYTSDYNTYEIVSRGSDGKEGGDKYNADITSKDLGD